jgi:hypothetical protein
MSESKEFWMHSLPQTEMEIEEAQRAQQDAIEKQRSERMHAHLQALELHSRTLNPPLTTEEIAHRQFMINQDAQEKRDREKEVTAATKRAEKYFVDYRRTGNITIRF